MQLLWDPGMSLEQYAKAESICYPTIKRCPVCGARTTLTGHGFYHRNALPMPSLVLLLAIRRLFCGVCHVEWNLREVWRPLLFDDRTARAA